MNSLSIEQADYLHHHHRGRLQLDPLLPDRTGCLPRHDVNTQKRPCSGNAERVSFCCSKYFMKLLTIK